MVNSVLAARVQSATPVVLYQTIVPYLMQVWLDDYWRRARRSDIVETSQGHCHYLFDLQRSRLIAAWAQSRGAHHGKRDASRMQGHPHGYGPLYHRGHCIPHSLGGPTDINLVPQLGAVNVGDFRKLERQAVATPGSLYFTNWRYVDDADMPDSVVQGLLVAGQPPLISVHRNRPGATVQPFLA